MYVIHYPVIAVSADIKFIRRVEDIWIAMIKMSKNRSF